jgi:hypothetical protein
MCLKGGMGRRSLEVLTEKTTVEIPKIMRPATAVLRFQAVGCGHQPPDGDHTYSNNIDDDEGERTR